MRLLRTSILVAFVICFIHTGQSKAQLTRTFEGHIDNITSIAASPGGKYILSGSADNTIRLWEKSNGREIREFNGHSNTVTSIAFSSNGQLVASGSEDNTIKLWQVATGREIRTLSGHTSNINSISISADGPHILSGSDDSSVKLWNLNTGQEILTFTGHSKPVTNVTLFQNGQYALSASTNNTIKLWDVNSNREIRSFSGHSDQITDLAVSPDNKYLLSASADSTAKLWDIETGKEIRTFSQHSGKVLSVSFSPYGHHIITATTEAVAKLWEIDNDESIRTYSDHSERITDVTFSSDGLFVLSGSADNTIKLWQVPPKGLITSRVQQKIEAWQQKGRYETTEAYQQRVTQEKRNELIEKYTSQLVDSLGRAQFTPKIAEADYDADNEIFELTLVDGESIYVEVPINKAPTFDRYMNRLRFSDMDFALTADNDLILRKARIHNPGNDESYYYDSGQQVAFNSAELATNFDPINVNPQNENPQSKVDKTTRKVEIGKSEVDTNIPETDMNKPDAIAVVIGNRDYKNDTPDVDYAVNDAKVVRDYLVETLGFKDNNILYEENASRSDMVVLFGNDKEQGRLANYLKPGRSEVFVFYSGHGAPDPNSKTGYLMPVDAKATALSLTGYPLDMLYNNLGKLDAKSVNVVIDACFSGATGSGDMLVKNASPIGIEVRNPAAKLEDGFVVTASSSSQIASWHPDKGHGLLTYFWLKAMQGEADLNDDGDITGNEISEYLTDPTDGLPYWARRLHNRDQMPQVFGSDSTTIVEHN